MTPRAQIDRVGLAGVRPDQIAVVEECAVAIEYNGISHAVMMATPSDLDDFALGFSLSEGILDRPEQLYSIDWSQTDLGWTIQLDIAGDAFDRIKRQRRQMTGRSGCGLCGTETLAHAIRPIPSVSALALSPGAVNRAVGDLKGHQRLGNISGGMHAAAWVDMNGDIKAVREDVGRHNALDKLIGATALWDSQGFVLVSSRASYEMVHKTCTAGFGALVAISAPTSLAIKLAGEASLTLIGLAKGSGYHQYGSLM